MRLFFTANALRQLQELPVDVQKTIINKLESVMTNSLIMKNSKKLKGEHSGQYRFRVGDYRVIFDADVDMIKILAVGHRKEIYR